MKLEVLPLKLEERTTVVKEALDAGDRLGLITSIDGGQLLTLLLSPQMHTVTCFQTPIEDPVYHSITSLVPQAHWFERTTMDMFGLLPQGHPRLKRTHLHEPYAFEGAPLCNDVRDVDAHAYQFFDVEGEGIYEIPVGPIHAGIIEPGHFRFSCYGEIILNLEIRLGYIHRGVEKRLTEVPCHQARFVAEAAASDMPVANALAHVTAMESLLDFVLPGSCQFLRTAALEIERIAMHLSDLGGLAGDIGFLAISSSMARLRGLALRMGELLTGNRLMRGYICIGGVSMHSSSESRRELIKVAEQLKQQLEPVIDLYLANQVAIDRMEGIGKISCSLAREFGLVGVAARSSGISYDCRRYWSHALFPGEDFEISVEQTGDVFARAKVRIREIKSSLQLLMKLLQEPHAGPDWVPLPEELPRNSSAVGIVESHRGELIHLIITDHQGKIQRYCIKDPSVNNWTALAIAVRNNLVADFPLCNKSFSLSYSGHDL